jgi:hypothetical protein
MVVLARLVMEQIRVVPVAQSQWLVELVAPQEQAVQPVQRVALEPSVVVKVPQEWQPMAQVEQVAQAHFAVVMAAQGMAQEMAVPVAHSPFAVAMQRQLMQVPQVVA